MDVLLKIDLDIFALLVLIIIFLSTWKRGYRQEFHGKLFLGLLFSNFLVLSLELAGRAVNGVPGLYSVNVVFNTLLFAVNILPAVFWLLYVHYQLHGEMKGLKRTFIVLAIIFVLHAAVALSSPFTGLMFRIADGNTYVRGPAYAVTAILNFGMTGYAFVYVLAHRGHTERKKFISLLLFPVLPALGGIIQAVVYELTTIWTFMALAVLMIFINVQNKMLYTDFLTGLSNRRQLDEYLRRKISEARESKSFGLVMMDIDDFKKINDTYGHAEGDRALEEIASVISSALRKEDFVARYAGDEFVAVLDTDGEEALEKAVGRIEKAVNERNESSDKPYEITLSIGYDLYSGGQAAGAENFFEEADELMYLRKRAAQEKTAF
jgi:diguanylate cyclase (GGDEF)-like protein